MVSRRADTLLPCAAGTPVSQRRRCSTSTSASGIRPEEATDIAPSWNVAPQTVQPVVRLDPETGVKEIVLIRWGLVPFFAKSPTHHCSTINTKTETILEKPTFRDCFRRRRCLVPIDAYFGWQVFDEQKNTPTRPPRS
jgi:putative SOS response-associated peptidase YedK